MSRTAGTVFLCACLVACNSILGISDPKLKDASVSSQNPDTSIEPKREAGKDDDPTDASLSAADASDAATMSDSSADGGRDASDDRDAIADGAREDADTSPIQLGDGATGSMPDARNGCSSGPCPLFDEDAGIAPENFVLDGIQPYLYWTEFYGRRIGRTHKETGETDIIGQAVGSPNGIAVDETSVYWADNSAGGVWRCPKTGCGAGPQLVSNGCGSSLDIALDDRNAYWTSKFGLTYGTVCSAPKDGVDAGFAMLWETETLSRRVATDRQGTLFFTADDGQLHRMNIDGGSLTSFGNADASAAGSGIALDVTSAYWAVRDPTAGTVSAVAKDGTRSRTLASSQAAPLALASDGIYLYWASFGTGPDGAILMCNIAQCSPMMLVSNAPYAIAILVDDVAIYWIEADPYGHPGSIWRMPKKK